MQRVRITISGFVQGIFFRSFIKEIAQELNLKGYVKNIENNKVEIVAEGHEIKINKLIEHCKKGPAGAKVENIKVENQTYKGKFKEFKIKT